MLVVKNAQLFNPPETVFSNEAKKLEAYGEKAISKEAPFAILPSSTSTSTSISNPVSIPFSAAAPVAAPISSTSRTNASVPSPLPQPEEPPKRKLIVLKRKNPGSDANPKVSAEEAESTYFQKLAALGSVGGIKNEPQESLRHSKLERPSIFDPTDSSVSRSDARNRSREFSREQSFSNDGAQRSLSPETARKGAALQAQAPIQDPYWTPSFKYRGKGPLIPKPAGIGSTIRTEATALASAAANKELVPGEGPEHPSYLWDGSIDVTDMSFQDRKSLLHPAGLGTQFKFLKRGAIELSGVTRSSLAPTPESLFPLPLDALYRVKELQDKQVEKLGIQNSGLFPSDSILASTSNKPYDLESSFSHNLDDMRPQEKVIPLAIPSRLWGIKRSNPQASSTTPNQDETRSYPTELPLTFPKPVPYKSSLAAVPPAGAEQHELTRLRARERERERDRDTIGNEEDWTVLRTNLTRHMSINDLGLYQDLVPDAANVGTVRSGIGPNRITNNGAFGTSRGELQLPMKNFLEGEALQTNLEHHLNRIPSFPKTSSLNPSSPASRDLISQIDESNKSDWKPPTSLELRTQGVRAYQEIREKVYGGGSLGLAYTSSLARFVDGAMKMAEDGGLEEGWIEKQINETIHQKREDEKLYQKSLKREVSGSAESEEEVELDFMGIIGMGIIQVPTKEEELLEAKREEEEMEETPGPDDDLKDDLKEYKMKMEDWTLVDSLPDYVRKRIIDPLTEGMHNILYQAGRGFSRSTSDSEPSSKRLKLTEDDFNLAKECKEGLEKLHFNSDLDSIQSLPSLGQLIPPLVHSLLQESFRKARGQLEELKKIEREKIELQSMLKDASDLLEQIQRSPSENEKASTKGKKNQEKEKVIRFKDQEIQTDRSKIDLILKQYSKIILKLANVENEEEGGVESRTSGRKKKEVDSSGMDEKERSDLLEEIRKGLIALVRNLPPDQVIGKMKQSLNSNFVPRAG